MPRRHDPRPNVPKPGPRRWQGWLVMGVLAGAVIGVGAVPDGMFPPPLTRHEVIIGFVAIYAALTFMTFGRNPERR